MKKYFSLALLCAAAIGFTGCAGEEDDLFDMSASDRLEQSAVTYSQRLSSPSNGWIMEYYPTKNTDINIMGRGYVLLADFDANKSVRIAMNNLVSDNVFMQDVSAWDIIKDNGPVLTFNTGNNCLHLFSTPDLNAGEGLGEGLRGDYEFIMIDVPENGDHVMLKGKKRGTYTRLTRLDDGVDYQAYLDDINAFTDKTFNPESPNILRLALGDSLLRIAKAPTGIANIYPDNGDPVFYEKSLYPFLVTKRGGKYYLRFSNAIGTEEANAQEFVFDEETNRFESIGETPASIYIDQDAVTFFDTQLADGHKFSFDVADVELFSPKVLVELNTLKNQIKKLGKSGYELKGISWNLTEEGKLRCTVQHISKITASTELLMFDFGYVKGEGEATLSYEGPVITDLDMTRKVMEKVPALEPFMQNIFGQKFEVTEYLSVYNMSKIKFTSTTDPDIWFIVNY